MSGRQWCSLIDGPRDRDHPELHHEDSARAAVLCALFRGPATASCSGSAALENRTRARSRRLTCILRSNFYFCIAL